MEAPCTFGDRGLSAIYLTGCSWDVGGSPSLSVSSWVCSVFNGEAYTYKEKHKEIVGKGDH